ncbi:hypothetical protein DQ04_00121180 [Trypanosoma grayi]|uniref:hypothetical protein n=1 Tax=Trypanosoma grayi TaxID=71804 RepID=UPI0004F4AE84|nr:hypothetical protein DQ04_00121180 [Trypanosoma grayi]KEG15286.1 hypothetical protein DQ04_00121180 [Trypanosoma grayi]
MVHNLVINCTFNCPEIKIIGPIKEQTIDKLNEVIPNSTTSSRSTRVAPPRFQYLSNPNHWYIKLDRQFCDDEAMSYLMVLLLDALEEEGVWKLVSSVALKQSIGSGPKDYTETHVLFLNKFSGDEL